MIELIEFYVNLLIIQYHNQPNAQAHIRALVSELVASNIYFSVRDGYDIDTAVGVQLDVIGKYADIDRFYYSTELTDDFFGFEDAADLGGVSSNIIGFDDAASPDKNGDFLSSTNIITDNLRLNDDAYRVLIKLRIIQNNSQHDTKTINDSLFEFFGTGVVMSDNYNMTMTYFIGDVTDVLINAALQKNVLPRPAAVGLQVISGNEFFGFADADSMGGTADYVVGFNDATAGLIKDGGFLNANTGIL